MHGEEDILWVGGLVEFLLLVWEHGGDEWLYIVVVEWDGAHKAPVYDVAGSPGDVVLTNSIALSLEDVLVESHLVGVELTVHLPSVHNKVEGIKELMGDLHFNLDIIDDSQGLVPALAIFSTSIV